MSKKLNRFAEIFSSEAEEHFLQDVDPDISYRTRLADEKQREKYAEKTKGILSESIVAPVVPVLKKYVSRCIPEPYFTEKEFWSISYMNGRKDGVQYIGSISSYSQEVFTVSYDLVYKTHYFSWHVSEEAFPNAYQLPCGEFTDTVIYQKWSDDQVQVVADSVECALKLLDDPAFLKAAKAFNVRSFVSGKNPWKLYHCPQFADLVMP